ncbi:MAG: matrixin family metalloprotease [Candidatus Hermodarchaeia archaeon]
MNGMVVFHIGNMSVRRLVMSYDDSNTWYAINVIKAYSTDEAIQIEEKKLGHIVNGLATFLEHTTFAFIVVDRIKEDEEFIGLVMHEVGHLLGLNHDVQGSIMHKYSSRLTDLTNVDRSQLIQVWRYWFGLSAQEFNYSD